MFFGGGGEGLKDTGEIKGREVKKSHDLPAEHKNHLYWSGRNGDISLGYGTVFWNLFIERGSGHDWMGSYQRLSGLRPTCPYKTRSN